MKIINKLTHIFTFFAFLTLIGCGTEEEDPTEVLTISLSSTTVEIGNTITFTLNSNVSGDVSSSAVFFVNGQAIEGNVFTPNEVNLANEVYATYNGMTSNTATFTSVEPGTGNTSFTQKVLVEDYTGTWCLYCPKMSLILDYFTQYSDRVIPMAIHCEGPQGGMNDPWVYEYSEVMASTTNYNAIGLPKGKINRIYNVNQLPYTCPKSDASLYTEQLDQYLNQTAPLGLSINSTLNGNNLNIQVKVGFATDNLPHARLVVNLVEEGLVHDQINGFWNTSFPDCVFNQPPYNVNPVPNFPQKHVLLKSYTDIFGDVIPANQISNGSVYTKDFNVTLPANVGYPSGTVNPNNLKIVAFVLGNGDQISNRPVINAQWAWVNTFQDFD